MNFITWCNVTLPKMRLAVVFAVIVELQRFWVFADPISSYREPIKVSDSTRMYKAQPDRAWMAAELRRLQRGFLPSSSSPSYSSRYQPRTSSATQVRYRPQESSQYQPSSRSSEYMQRRDGFRHKCFQSRPESDDRRYAAVGSRPMSKYVTKNYRQFSESPKSYPRPETKYNSLPQPQVNSEGYQVVNEDPAVHMAVISPSHQYSQPQVITIQDNGQGYTTSQVREDPSQGPPMTYEYSQPSRGMENAQPVNDVYIPYSPNDQRQEMPYKPRYSQHSSMHKPMTYVGEGADSSSHRIEVLSNRQILDIVNQ